MHKISSSKHFKLLAWLLAFCFLISSYLLTNHRFSHEITDFLANDVNSSISIHDTDQFLPQKALDQKSHHNHSNCELCFSSIIQSQLLSFNFAAFLLLFYGLLTVVTNYYYHSKNHLNFSIPVRAPPFFS